MKSHHCLRGKASRAISITIFSITFSGALPAQQSLPHLFRPVSFLQDPAEASASRPPVLSPDQADSTATADSAVPLLPGADSRTASQPDSYSPAPSYSGPSPRVAPFYHRYIEPGQTAQKLTTGQQVILGLSQSISPYFLLTISAAAGYEQAVNGAPNYGSNFTAYGQRVGAAAARNASQSFFSYSVMAPLLHEDARYYIMGNRRNAFVRTLYAASRAVVTRDADDGHLVPNYAEISGYAEAAALSNAYYPPVNRTFGRTAKSYGVSLGGLAISNVVREFLPDIQRFTHLDHLYDKPE